MAFVSARLTELELKFMRLERHVEELSGVIADQQKTIDRLVVELRTRGLTEGDVGPEKPPHY